jgi:hypothetical protein
MFPPKIDKYKFGHIVIDGETHTKDVIILPDEVIGGWWRREGHVLHSEDLEAVIEATPEVLVVGKGAYGRMRISLDAQKTLKKAGIKVVSENTDAACQQYNQLREKCKAAAALHLTC